MPNVTRRKMILASAVGLAAGSAVARAAEQRTLTLVVMDPLSDKLACDCVKGYAQRKYEKLAEFLAAHTGCKVQTVFGGSLDKALAKQAGATADLVIGKHSVIEHDAARLHISLTPVAQLTGKDGKVTQTGLIVVRTGDPAKTLADLKGYRIFFGPADCDEKSSAPRQLLAAAGVVIEGEPETCPACSDAATKLVELPQDSRAAAVISSYAQPLLEGCGTVKKGDLRIIGETLELPFISAFVNPELPADVRNKIAKGLDDAQYDIDLLVALESKSGFTPWFTVLDESAATAAAADTKKKSE